MTPRRLFRTEIALAMELRLEGCQWQYIASGLGVNRQTLQRAVKYAEINGWPAEAPAVCSKIRTNYINERAGKILGINPGRVPGHGPGLRESVEA